MTGSGNAASADIGAQGLMGIGEILTRLRVDFPDTTISKLRFLEAEGLVEPRRAASGYRKYSRGDLARLRFILTAQRDHYLPLRVIREQLAVGTPETPLRLVAPLAAPDERHEHESTPVSRAALLARVGMTEEWLDGVERYGLVNARADGGYDPEAAEIVEVVAQLDEHGLEPRHLRPFRAAADRELGLFQQIVSAQALHRNPETRARAAETLRELAALAARLHTALLQAGLRSPLEG